MGRGKGKVFFSPKLPETTLADLVSNFELIKIKIKRSLFKHTFSSCIFPDFSLQLKQTGKVPVMPMCQNPKKIVL